MIITKKQFEAAMAKVRDEERQKYEKWANERDEERWRNERMNELEKRMSNAFDDIDRRLTELEKRNAATNAVAVCPKY